MLFKRRGGLLRYANFEKYSKARRNYEGFTDGNVCTFGEIKNHGFLKASFLRRGGFIEFSVHQSLTYGYNMYTGTHI